MLIAYFTFSWSGTHAFNIRLELCWQFPNIIEYRPLERYSKTVDQIVLKYDIYWVPFWALRSQYISAINRYKGFNYWYGVFCIELQHWSLTCFVPSHDLNHFCCIVICTQCNEKILWKFGEISIKIFPFKNALEIVLHLHSGFIVSNLLSSWTVYKVSC